MCLGVNEARATSAQHLERCYAAHVHSPTSVGDLDRLSGAELWELERLDGQLRALARQHIDEAPHRYTRNPRYQAALRLLAEITADRAQIEQRLPQPEGPETAILAEAMRPKVLRRVLSGPITIR
jgi:hypothetical protein